MTCVSYKPPAHETDLCARDAKDCYKLGKWCDVDQVSRDCKFEDIAARASVRCENSVENLCVTAIERRILSCAYHVTNRC